MKKNNFYKKMGNIIAFVLGTSIVSFAQTDTTIYKIDHVHNGDGGLGSISVLNLIVQKGNYFSLNKNYKQDSIIWMYYDVVTQVEKHSSDTVIYLTSNSVIRAYALNGTQWYTQKGVYSVVPKENPKDTVVTGGKGGTKDTLVTSNPKDTVITGGNNGGHQDTLVTENPKDTIIKSGNNGIKYDSTRSGNLIAPIIKDANYTWYFKDTLLSNTNNTLYPEKIGTYKVVIEWTTSANLRTEESTTNSVTFVFEVKSLPILTSIENISSEATINAVYPNPASDVAYINAKGSFEYSIETANTELVTSGAGNDLVQLDLRGMNAGIYFVRIKTNEKQSVKRLVVR